ncbi:MAG: cytochrome ubiquinol oxidase subunit I [Gemmatimonadaceae bacterium]
MGDPAFWHRAQFAFTIVFHYLFPVLTMGLALLIVIMKAIGLGRDDLRWDAAARFWIRIFGITFAVGVVTGIPMEFQFGTNWAAFSRYSGSVIGNTLAMEGLFAFFLESSFLSLLIFGERRLGRRRHFAMAIALFAGSWLSGYFIIATNAFMQRPIGYAVAADGSLRVADFGAFLLNPWALAQYAHNMIAAVATAAFVVAAVGAYYALKGIHMEFARIFLHVGVFTGLVSSLLVAFPTGDTQAKLVARYQPVALAAMEGRFTSGGMAELNIIGQPNVAARRLDNPIRIPGALSFLAYGTFHGNVRGLEEFPEQDWPNNIELLYYSFHLMAGLGTIMIAIMAVASLLQWHDRLMHTRKMLWVLMLTFPFPYIAVTTGWLTAELGRQPWLIYGLFRTADGVSPLVHPGTVLFTLIGFTGIYFVLGMLYLFLVGREVAHGPSTLAVGEPAHG